MIKLAHKFLDNGGPTVTENALHSCPACVGVQPTTIGISRVHLLLTLLGLWAPWSHRWHCDGPPLDRGTFVVSSRFGVLEVFILP